MNIKEKAEKIEITLKPTSRYYGEAIELWERIYKQEGKPETPSAGYVSSHVLGSRATEKTYIEALRKWASRY